MPTVLVQADDFSGAAEVGQQFVAHGLAVRITLTTVTADAPAGDVDVLVVDTHSRGLSSEAASVAVQTAVRKADPSRAALVFKKTDSLWRGNIGAELSALTGLGYHVVLAGALPAMQRTVVGARPLAGGVPLAASDLWAAESLRPPEGLVELLPEESEVRFAGLDDVRSADFGERLARTLRSAAPAVVIVDGETEADLAVVVEALAARGFSADGRQVALAGTGQIAGLLARRLAHGSAHTAHAPSAPAHQTGFARERTPVLAVVGSASPAAHSQLEHLAAEGFDVVGIGSGPVDECRAAARIRASLGQCRPVALTVADVPVDAARSGSIVACLARLASESLEGTHADLILTGGETAREVLDALAISSLVPRAAVQHGAVVSTADDGRLVATKPGSFGDPLVLVQLYRAIQTHPATHPAGLPAR